jgi:hypothetical protein
VPQPVGLYDGTAPGSFQSRKWLGSAIRPCIKAIGPKVETSEPIRLSRLWKEKTGIKLTAR